MPDAPTYFLVFAVVGVLGALAMLSQIRSRGARAIVMSSAFISFAMANFAVYKGWPEWSVWLSGGALIVFLLADIVLKSLAGKK